MSTATRTLTPAQQGGLAWLLVAGAGTYAPLADELPAWVGAAFIGLLLWRHTTDRRGWRLPGRVLRAGLAVIGLVLVHVHYGTLLGRDPGVAFLVWLAGTKTLELTSERDVMLWAFLLFLMLLGGFLYDQSPLHAAYGLAVVVLIVAGIMRLHEHSPLTPGIRLRRAAGIVIQALPLMLLMYVLFPRLPAPLWSLPVHTDAAFTGISDEMRPGSIGELVRSEAIAFRVHFEGVPPPAAARYWRVRVLWESDGLIWRAGANPPASPGLTPLGEPVSYRVTLEPTGKTWLPALDLPFSAPAGAGLQGGAVLVRRRAVNERLAYDVRSHLAYRTGPLSARERNRGLAVPPTSDRVRALAQSWRNAAKSDEQVVQAALAYFRNQPFYYTLSPPTLGADPVDEFLFETRQGFCEHYAAAFTTLMRAAGVPARVVIGYQGGLHNPAGDYYMVRQADAHAWSEVWLENQGWVRVDPTAAVAPERVEQGIDSVGLADVEGRTAEAASETARWLARAWQRAHFTWDAFNLSWFYWVKDYDEDRQARLLERVGLHESAGVVLVAGVLGVALAYAWLAGRAPRPRDPLVRTYRRYCRKLARAGLPRSPNEGPLDYARRAGRRWPELRPTIEAITARYVALRYGPADARDEHAALERAVRHFAVRRRR